MTVDIRLPTAQRIRQLLRYDPDTGLFVWLTSNSKRAKVGAVAGHTCKTHGYVFIRVDGVLHRAHRLAWVYMQGQPPSDEVDHKNRIRSDNRWLNLRLAEHWQNCTNVPARSHSKSGVKGVRRLKSGRWNVRVKDRGTEVTVGTFDTLQMAKQAYESALIAARGHFAHSV